MVHSKSLLGLFYKSQNPPHFPLRHQFLHRWSSLLPSSYPGYLRPISVLFCSLLAAMLDSCCIAFLLFALAATTGIAAKPTPSNCVDAERNSSLEYVSVARHTFVGTLNPNFACYLVTQCSVDRLDRLGKQLRAWGGATSAAIYIPTNREEKQKKSLSLIGAFVKELQKEPQYRGWLIISVLFGHEGRPELWNCTEPGSPGAPTYPINALRNLAVAATGGDPSLDAHHIPPYLLYLDVDFLPSAGLSDWIHIQASSTADRTLHSITSSGGVVVLPAFESFAPDLHTAIRPLDQILKGIMAGTVKQFHVKRFRTGHNATNYNRWTQLSIKLSMRRGSLPFAPYKVNPAYSRGYEPYFIMARSAFVPYDERFRGYGFNKGINIRWLSENGTTFHVQPGHFVIEDAHPVPVLYTNHIRRGVDFTPYERAVSDILAKRMPLVSNTTAQLLRAAGFGAVATEDPVAHKAYLGTLVAT